MTITNDLVAVTGRIRSNNKVGAHNPFLTDPVDIVDAMLSTLDIQVEHIEMPDWYRYEVERSVTLTLWSIDLYNLRRCQEAELDFRLHWRNYELWFNFDNVQRLTKPQPELALAKGK